MKPHAISLVLIVRNTAPWLKACLDSIAAQTFRDFEVVVVDVDSNLRTRLALARHSRQLDAVRLYRQRQNIGGAAAGNIGIREARGDFVFLMDSDDVLPPHALESLHAAAIRDSLDVVIGRPLTIIGQSIKNMRYRADMVTWARPLETDDLARHPELTMAPYYWGRLYRRQMLLDHDVSMRPGRLFADRYFTCKALRSSRRTGVILDNTYLWRRDRGEGARSRSITQRSGSLEVLKDRLESFAEVESLFHGPADASLLQYVRLSNLMRLFIHTRHLSYSEDERGGLVDHLLPYARSFSSDDVWSCEFLLARQKVQWHLIVNERWEELATFQTVDQPTCRPASDGLEYLPYDELFADIPKAACLQHVSKIEDVTGLVRARAGGLGWSLDVRARIPDGMEIEPLHVTFKGRRPDQDTFAPVTEATPVTGALTLSVPVPGTLQPDALPILALGFLSHGRYCTQEIALRPPADDAEETP